MKNKKLEKFRVCQECLSVSIIDPNCVCAYSKYKIIELEFEVCACCGNVVNDGEPADTEFNKRVLKNI